MLVLLVLSAGSAGCGPLLPRLLVLVICSTHSPPCKQLLAVVGVGAGSSVIGIILSSCLCGVVVPVVQLSLAPAVSTLRAGACSGGVGWLLHLPVVFRHFVVISLLFPPCEQMLAAVVLGAAWVVVAS